MKSRFDELIDSFSADDARLLALSDASEQHKRNVAALTTEAGRARAELRKLEGNPPATVEGVKTWATERASAINLVDGFTVALRTEELRVVEAGRRYQSELENTWMQRRARAIALVSELRQTLAADGISMSRNDVIQTKQDIDSLSRWLDSIAPGRLADALKRDAQIQRESEELAAEARRREIVESERRAAATVRF